MPTLAEQLGGPSVAESFFDEQLEQSQVKTAIVTKYLWAWARVITSAQAQNGKPRKIAYIDLLAGPGRYKSGSKSTPVLILDQAVKNGFVRANASK